MLLVQVSNVAFSRWHAWLHHDCQMRRWDASRDPEGSRNVKPPEFLLSPLDTSVLLLLRLVMMVDTMDPTSGQGMF